MYTYEFYISQDFTCLIVIIYIVFGFRQTQPHAFDKLTFYFVRCAINKMNVILLENFISRLRNIIMLETVVLCKTTRISRNLVPKMVGHSQCFGKFHAQTIFTLDFVLNSGNRNKILVVF